jgi:hypothetical protein
VNNLRRQHSGGQAAFAWRSMYYISNSYVGWQDNISHSDKLSAFVFHHFIK